MNSNIINNMANPLSNQDVATKNYVDTNAFTTASGVVSGDIQLNVGSDLAGSLGCNDLLQIRSLHFCWVRHKYAIVLRTKFRITSACQDKN